MVTYKTIILPKYAENVQNKQYTAPVGSKCIIDKMVIRNDSVTSCDLTVYLVPFGGTEAGINTFFHKTIYPSETVEIMEVEGMVLESGASLATLASASGAIAITASGREVVA